MKWSTLDCGGRDTETPSSRNLNQYSIVLLHTYGRVWTETSPRQRLPHAQLWLQLLVVLNLARPLYMTMILSSVISPRSSQSYRVSKASKGRRERWSLRVLGTRFLEIPARKVLHQVRKFSEGTNQTDADPYRWTTLCCCSTENQ